MGLWDVQWLQNLRIFLRGNIYKMILTDKNMKEKRRNSSKRSTRAQITIFIIIAIILVFIAALFFFWSDLRGIFVSASPESYLQTCMKQYGQEALEKVEASGGSINPQNYVLYNDDKIEYLCYTNENYKTCVMQKPLLREYIESEISSYMQPRMRECLNSFKNEFEGRGFSVRVGEVKMMSELSPGKLKIIINSALSVSQDSVSVFDNFDYSIPTELYDFSMIALSILNWEARYGNSETTSYMTYYPDTKVEKIRLEDGTKIYALEDRENGERFVFATRSLAWPAGLGYGEVNTPNRG